MHRASWYMDEWSLGLHVVINSYSYIRTFYHLVKGRRRLGALLHIPLLLLVAMALHISDGCGRETSHYEGSCISYHLNDELIPTYRQRTKEIEQWRGGDMVEKVECSYSYVG